MSRSFAERINPLPLMQRVELEGRGQWLAGVDIRALLDAAVPALGNDIRLAGRRVSA
jgi:hypothetical protein